MKVQDLLTDESKWCQGYLARKSDGEPIKVESPDAAKWCLIGALALCYPVGTRNQIERIRKHLDRRGVASWNDAEKRTFADVRRLIEELDL